MFANNRLLSIASGRVAALAPRVRQPVKPAELAHWHRAYIGVPIDIAAKLLVLGIVLSFAVRAMTHEGYNSVGHKWHAVHGGQLTQP
jgi:hypothetical protein